MPNAQHPRAQRAPSLLRRRFAIVVLLLGAVPALAVAHDMFLKPAQFSAAPNSDVLLRVINGTFTKSENAITRDRVADITIAAPAGKKSLPIDLWTDKGDTSTLTVRTGESGTYIVGASTKPRILALPAKDFNEYLKSDGIPDVLAARKKSGELNVPSKERYHKHIKTLVQVGEKRTPVDAVLGYPAELVPLDNPYDGTRTVIRFRTLVEGKASANEYVVYGGRRGDVRIPPASLRSDASGVVSVPLAGKGTWYVKFIHMTPVSGDSAATYESKWASITFETR